MNTLAFKLALNSSQFSAGLRSAAGQLGGFLGVAAGVGGVIAATWKQAEKGARLFNQSAVLGESVKSLYSVEEAFMRVGRKAEEMPKLMLRWQYAISGAGGESYNRVFREMGLDMQKLAAMPTPKGIEEGVTSFSVIDVE